MNVVETVLVMLMVSAGSFAAAPYVQGSLEKMIEHYCGDTRLRAVITQMKRDAKLVFTGTITGMRVENHGAMERGEQKIKSLVIYRFKVDSVEQGQYNESELEAYMGWGSNHAAPVVYPAGVKTSYTTGDRVRVFLSYGDVGGFKDEPYYYAEYFYFCLEPLYFELPS